MSDSPPENKKSRKTARRLVFYSSLGLAAWWLGSILIHSALFGLLYLGAPSKPAEGSDSSEFAMTISPNRVREVVKEIRDSESENFQDKVEQLAKIKAELDKLNAEKIDQYNELMRQEAVNAPEKAAAAAKEALEAQSEALAEQAKAQAALDQLKNAEKQAASADSREIREAAQAQAQDAARTAKDAQAAVKLAQRKAAIAQNEVGEQLQLLGDDAAARAAHDAAVAAQNNANSTQQKSAQVGEIDSAIKALTPAQAAADREKAALEKAKAQLAAAEDNAKQQKEAAEAAKKQAEAAQSAATAATQNSATAVSTAQSAAETVKQSSNQAKQSTEEVKKAEAAVAKAKQELTQAEVAAKNAQDALAKQQIRSEASEAVLAKLVPTEPPTVSPDSTAPTTPPPASENAISAAKQNAENEKQALAKSSDQATGAEKNRQTKVEALTDAEKKLAEAQKAAADAANAAAAALAANQKAEADKKQSAEASKNAAEAARKEVAAAAKLQNEAKQVEAASKKASELAAQQQAKTDAAETALAKKQEALGNTVAETVTRQQSATTEQKSSLELQKAANEAVAKAAANFSPDKATNKFAEQPASEPLPDPNGTQNLAELFEQAKSAEQAVADSFRNVRAAELASIRKIPLEEALKLTEVAKPDRPELDNAILNQDIADVKGVRAQEKAISDASAQMDSMVSLAERMKELADKSSAGTSIAGIQAQSAQNERMEELAAEDSGTKAKDLSAEMAAADGQSGGVHGAEAGASAAMLQLSNAAAALGMNPFNPKAMADMAKATQAAAEAAKQGAGGGGGGGTLANNRFAGQRGVPGIANVKPEDYKPIPGRRIRSGAVDVEAGRNPYWMYVDSWYLIGPWPNPGRKNLNTKFPPETVVDLDAVYQGGRKDEKPFPIRWKFYQLPTTYAKRATMGMIAPPGLQDFELYYAYTELWFDEEMDLWVAIGSDDQSKVWINDQLVWKSADYYKSWAPNEGLRKVHFRKGTNRILYRLENGQFTGGFSFLVCVSEPK